MRITLSVSAALVCGLAIVASANAESAHSSHLPSTTTTVVRDQAKVDSAIPATTKPLIVLPPVCPGPSCPDFDAPTPKVQYKRTVYLNFDGATIKFGSDNATNDSSRILRFDSRVIPAMQKEHLNESSVSGLSLQQIKDIVVDNVRVHMAPYDVEIVTERPSSGSYHMIMFSPVDDCNTIAGANCAGIAPLDCYDSNPSNIVWVFAGGLRVSDLGTTSSHEAAHALGIFHTLDTKDIMYPSILNQVPDHFGAGSVPDGGFNCQNETFQDSDELLIDTIGSAGPDTKAPDVVITQPAEGIVIGPGSMIEARVLDEQSAIEEVQFYLNGELKRTLTREQRPWVEFLGASFPVGPLKIRVVAKDMAGNTSESTVNVEFDRGGNTPCTTDEQCTSGFECNGTVCVQEDQSAGTLGTECGSDDECDSGVCATLNGESLCTQLCDEQDVCPGGFECLDGGGCWPADGGRGGGGCSVNNSSGGHGLGLFFFAAIFAFGLRRRSR